ncbi:MAG: hypothetical protein FWE16_02950 [Firmicutes bacterium]|nr:hypothetical protein [Bacillota bacterium]
MDFWVIFGIIALAGCIVGIPLLIIMGNRKFKRDLENLKNEGIIGPTDILMGGMFDLRMTTGQGVANELKSFVGLGKEGRRLFMALNPDKATIILGDDGGGINLSKGEILIIESNQVSEVKITRQSQRGAGISFYFKDTPEGAIDPIHIGVTMHDKNEDFATIAQPILERFAK